MKTAVLYLCVLIAVVPSAWGGVNANGAMLVHTNDAYVYTLANRCSTPYVQGLVDCSDVITRTDRTPTVVWLLAAFAEGSSPRVAALACKITYGPDVFVDTYWMCPAGGFEVPDPDWPNRHTHNSMAFIPPIVGDILFPFYGFIVWNDGGAEEFCTEIDAETDFVDDGSPPINDQCYKYGCVRWYSEGLKQCPQLGACCYPDGHCEFQSQQECYESGGDTWMEGQSCMPNPCPQPMGACCINTVCVFVDAATCYGMGGQYWFQNYPCDPNPCATLAVGDPETQAAPAVFGAAFPNPSSGTLECEVVLRDRAQVRAHLYDLSGRPVKDLFAQELSAGLHTLSWLIREPNGTAIPSGMYVLRLEATILSQADDHTGDGDSPTVTSVQRVVLLK